MGSKVIMLAAASLGLVSGSAWGAQPSEQTTEQAALSQCVALKTSGADRILTARWLFAVLSKSSQIADLSAVTPERTKSINQDFAKLVVRLVTKDCINEVRPLAAANVDDAFGEVGEALGDTAMKELMNAKEVEKGIGDYADFISKDDFKPLMDSLPTKAKQP